jgi:hypothetical protein
VIEGDFLIALHQILVQGERLSKAIERNELITLDFNAFYVILTGANV